MSKITIFSLLILAISAQHLRQQILHSSSKKFLEQLLLYLLSPFIFILAFPIIWYNQRKSSIDSKRLYQAKTICKSYPPNANLPKQQLVHMVGQSVSSQILQDNILGLSVKDAIKLQVQVQVKEWRRVRSQMSITHLEWAPYNIQQVEDDYNNPKNWIINSQTIYSPNVFIGRYKLSQSQIQQCHKKNYFVINENLINKLKKNYPLLLHKYVTVLPDNDFVYFSQTPDYEAEGSMRISASYCPTGSISVVCQVSLDGRNLEQYKIQDDLQNQKFCFLSDIAKESLAPINNINLVEQEIITKQQQIQNAIRSNSLSHTMMRVTAYFMLVLSIVILLSPISKVLGFIPLVGGILKGVSSLVFLLSAIIIAIPLYLVTFSIAWIVYNPRKGIIILVTGLAIFVVLVVVNYLSTRHAPIMYNTRPLLISHGAYY